MSYDDDPRQGEEVERMLGLSEGTKIVKQRMIVIGNSANIEMFEIVSDLQDGPLKLEDLGFNHISLFVENMDKAISDACDLVRYLYLKNMITQDMRIVMKVVVFI